MFQFRRFPAYCYFIHSTLTRYCRAGFPHSDIHGSKDICSSPQLFAACRVLHRLLMPRHSPCALISLTLWSAHSCSQNYAGFTEVRKMLCYPLKVPHCCLPRFRATPSVALLAFIIPLFSFQGAASGLRPEQNTQKRILEYFGPFSGTGGDKRVRTADLLRAKQALSQLSYTPMRESGGP